MERRKGHRTFRNYEGAEGKGVSYCGRVRERKVRGKGEPSERK